MLILSSVLWNICRVEIFTSLDYKMYYPLINKSYIVSAIALNILNKMLNILRMKHFIGEYQPCILLLNHDNVHVASVSHLRKSKAQSAALLWTKRQQKHLNIRQGMIVRYDTGIMWLHLWLRDEHVCGNVSPWYMESYLHNDWVK